MGRVLKNHNQMQRGLWGSKNFYMLKVTNYGDKAARIITTTKLSKKILTYSFSAIPTNTIEIRMRQDGKEEMKFLCPHHMLTNRGADE